LTKEIEKSLDWQPLFLRKITTTTIRLVLERHISKELKLMMIMKIQLSEM